MKQLEVNPNNEHYYTKDFVSGFRCGTQRQLESDLTVLDSIRGEIEQIDGKVIVEDYVEFGSSCPKYIQLEEVLRIIDKYKVENKEKVK